MTVYSNQEAGVTKITNTGRARPMKGLSALTLITSGAANNEMPPPVFDEKGIRLEFAQFGHFDSFEVFRSLTSMIGLADHELSAPIATGLKTMRFIDQINLKTVLDRDLYYRVRVIRGNQSLLSDELQTYISTFNAPQNLTVAYTNGTLEMEWDFESVTEHRYYCSESPININSLPMPKAIIAGNLRTYVDTDVEIGKTYYVRVGSVKNGVEKLSIESVVDVGDKHFSNVVMISNMSASVSGSLINDVKEHIFTLRTGSAAIVDDPNAYDSKALFVNGGVQSASSSDWNFDGKFTIETRFKFASHQMYGGILCCASNVTAWLGWNIIFDNTSNNLRAEINQAYSLVSSISLLTSAYYDICLERDENNLVRLYVNGAVVASGMYVGAINTAGSPLLLGIERTFAYKTVATYDAVRITKGVARYVGAYTPTQKSYFEF